MNLIKVSVHGFRRFLNESTMNLDAKIIAIVGPNEAGKSSFLMALQQLNPSPPPLRRSGPSQDLTRGGPALPDSHKLVTATFYLDDNDRQAIANIEGGTKVRWLKLSRLVNGRSEYSLVPRPRRSLRERKAAHSSLSKLSQSAPFAAFSESREEADEVSLELHVDQLLTSLSSESETLPKSDIPVIRSLSERLESIASEGGLRRLRQVATVLNSLADYEEKPSPIEAAANILLKRTPEFVFFDQDQRDLQPDYALAEIEGDPPLALSNLFSLAELDLDSLITAEADNDPGLLESLLLTANQKLEEAFSEAWTQSGISVRLRLDAGRIHVLVGSASSSFDSIVERSDGLRQFVALLAFSRLRTSDRPVILLIDEAESHLHYDAQADLVQMLSRQELAKKVIYTTHSLGCLPEDLGCGVRMIEAIEDGQTEGPKVSRIQNWFWNESRPGFDPILFGMGARTLAFFPVRYALVAEGITEVLLLPTLLRRALGRSYLGFQVVPGLSAAGKSDFAKLELSAPRVAYLVDSDGGGKALARQLTAAGIERRRIVSLGKGMRSAHSLEDFIDPEVYIKAVNAELERSHGGKVKMSLEDLPSTGRWARAVDEFCKKRQVNAPSKRAVAYRVLDHQSDACEEILHKQRRSHLSTLYGKVLGALAPLIHHRAQETHRTVSKW